MVSSRCCVAGGGVSGSTGGTVDREEPEVRLSMEVDMACPGASPIVAGVPETKIDSPYGAGAAETGSELIEPKKAAAALYGPGVDWFATESAAGVVAAGVGCTGANGESGGVPRPEMSFLAESLYWLSSPGCPAGPCISGATAAISAAKYG